MFLRTKNSLTLLVLLCIASVRLYAQEEVQTLQHGRKYLDINIHALDKYNTRLQHQQERLIKKLKRKEFRFAVKLLHKDSAAYESYKAQNLTYDSIGKLLRPDSATVAAKFKRRSNDVIDSLKGVTLFLQSKTSQTGNTTDLQTYNSELGKLNSELNYRKYINDLISQRTTKLKGLTGLMKNGDFPVLNSIAKQVFYGKAKMKAYKDMADEPSKAEEKALEYLQGVKGFDKSVEKATASEGTSMQNLSPDVTGAELERMGFQTKQQVLSGLTQRLGKGIPGFKEKFNAGVQNFQAGLADAKKAKSSIKDIKNISKPSFKVNPMRGLPFRKRLEKQYDWQTIKSTLNGQPAVLELSGMVAFKHTPNLAYGLGLKTDLGLGTNWSHIHFTWQGLGFKSYVTWQWQYGLGAYGGYERLYLKTLFQDKEMTSESVPVSAHSNNNWQESALLGLTKSYNINEKWRGSIQVLYDFWARDRGVSCPVIIRFATIHK
jgi:ribosomal protein S8